MPVDSLLCDILVTVLPSSSRLTCPPEKPGRRLAARMPFAVMSWRAGRPKSFSRYLTAPRPKTGLHGPYWGASFAGSGSEFQGLSVNGAGHRFNARAGSDRIIRHRHN